MELLVIGLAILALSAKLQISGLRTRVEQLERDVRRLKL